MNGHGWNGGGDNLKLEEEVIAVLGEWCCFLQGWDLVECHHEKEGVTAALEEWGSFLQAWGYHPELGHHLGEGASDLGEWVFHWMEVSCHLGDWGCVNRLRIDFTGWNGHVI